MRFVRACGVVFAVSGLILAGGADAQTKRSKASGSKAQEINPGNRGAISGVGIESRDIVSMTDQMARDILSVPDIAGRTTPPRVIIDDAYFRNESTQRLNKAIITDRLRVGLNRASAGRLVFVGREFADMVAAERQLKREGVTDVGTTGMTRAQAGADFRLTGRISSLDQAQASTGMIQRYNQITFELVDLESGIVTWSNVYEFERAGADDVVYR